MAAFPAAARREQVRALRAGIARLEGLASPAGEERISTGLPALDRLLPGGGVRPGTLVEWLADLPGGGAGVLACRLAWQACRRRPTLAVVDAAGQFYPPAAVQAGIELEHLLLVRPRPDDLAWTLDQVLRCRGVGAVLAWLDDLPGSVYRRWQLAAESGGGLGIFVRPLRYQSQPSWAAWRFRVDCRPGSRGRRLRIEVHGRAATCSAAVELSLDEQSPGIAVAAAVERAAAPPDPAGGG